MPSITVTPRNAARGPGRLLALGEAFKAQSCHITRAWGSTPAECPIDYVPVGASDVFAPVPAWAELQVEVTHDGASAVFHGVCRSDVAKQGSDGNTRTIVLVDFRTYLHQDHIVCAFNQAEPWFEGNVKRVRYSHILPADGQSGKRTRTVSPFSARQIIDFILGFTRRNHPKLYTVETEWARLYHGAQEQPVYGLDFQNGPTVAAALQEISDKQGLVFGLVPNDLSLYRLVWVRKGDGVVPFYPVVPGGDALSIFPARSDQRRQGSSLSGAPTRVRIIGDANRYQVMNVELIPDWLPAWERFIDAGQFEDDIFQRAKDPGTGRRFNALPSDPQQIQGRFLASAFAKEITVGQYADLRRGTRLAGEPSKEPLEWRDLRTFSSRSRADMPAALYLSTLLFRAFRPKPFSIKNAAGFWTNWDSLTLQSGLLAPVSHDPATGKLTYTTKGLPAEGTGYVIARGYQVGGDAFKTVRPEHFRLSDWQSNQLLWQKIEVQATDTSDPSAPVLLFAEPVIQSANLFVQGTETNDYPVVRANPEIKAPAVRAALVFTGERFSHIAGSGGLDGVEVVQNLGGHFVATAGGETALDELPFADGGYARAKAAVLAATFLARPPIVVEGGFRAPGLSGFGISEVYDRVEIHAGPAGVYEVVDFTKERGRDTFVGERFLDRITREEGLLPGEAELRQSANQSRLLAAGLKSSPLLSRTLAELIAGGTDTFARFLPGSVPAEAAVMPVGVPLWKAPATGTPAYAPASEHNVFVGVTARNAESPVGFVPVHVEGETYARVQGPVAVNQPVGRNAKFKGQNEQLGGGDYLVANGSPSVGQARQAITDTSIKLIPVTIGAGGGGTVEAATPFEIVGQGDNRVSVRAGYLMAGLDFGEIIPVQGLDTVFTVGHADKIWLELLFDFTARPACYRATIARGPNWNGFPSGVEVLRPGELPTSAVWITILEQQYVGMPPGVISAVLAEVMGKAQSFPATPSTLRKQARAFVLIGYATESPVEGIALTETVPAAGSQPARNIPFKVVQCQRTNLMLAGFCENAVPVQFPIAAGTPYVQLPYVVIEAVPTDKFALSAPGFATAMIRYRLVAAGDTSETTTANTTVYTAPFATQANRVIKAFAELAGYPRGPVAEKAV